VAVVGHLVSLVLGAARRHLQVLILRDQGSALEESLLAQVLRIAIWVQVAVQLRLVVGVLVAVHPLPDFFLYLLL
jgi:hypothetical protein